ncbi:PAS domain-containing sensor histidine kinase [Halorubrum aethiopicum]|uniref:PAS domain-containing sensor histidine kinase n=1 Tax=Halorubrum aethiopicum TaxID=1758255 RepID=UPI00083195EF|nr:PAS domain S-box protein [Halorubrum aethiopicum]
MTDSPEPETLLDLAGETVVVLDEEGAFRYLNATVTDVLGFEPADLVGESVLEFVHPDDERRVERLFATAVDGVPPEETFEYRYRTADGEWVWLQSDLYPPAETGVDGYVMSSRNVTGEVESIRRLETIVSTSPDVLWMFDADWSELLFANDSLGTVFGMTSADLRADPSRFLDVVHPDDRRAVERAMARLSAGEPVRIDYRIEPSTGEAKWVRVPAEPVYEDGGEGIVAISGFARDVTAEYRRNRQLTVMDNLLRHTIRNDMNVVMGTAERIADRTTDGLETHAETIRRVAAELLDTAEKQRDVIDLLGESGAPRPLPVEPLVSEAVERVRTRDPRAEFDVSCVTEATAVAVPELRYAIDELVENAVEHAESAPVVRIGVGREDERVAIAVRDNCPPIPTEQRRAVTDEWEMDRLRHTVGMGLWLVYWIAERSGGSLAFDTHPNGNVVTLCLPGARETACECAVESTGTREPTGAEIPAEAREPTGTWIPTGPMEATAEATTRGSDPASRRSFDSERRSGAIDDRGSETVDLDRESGTIDRDRRDGIARE